MELSKDIIGKQFPPYSIQVERGKIREFCLAIGEKNPLYLDPEVARKMGFSDTPIPPSFQTTFTFWGCPTLFEDIRKLGIDTDRLLHLKEEYTYLKPVYPGMTIHTQMEVNDVKTGKMDMVTFRSDYKNEENEICIKADMSIIITPR